MSDGLLRRLAARAAGTDTPRPVAGPRPRSRFEETGAADGARLETVGERHRADAAGEGPRTAGHPPAPPEGAPAPRPSTPDTTAAPDDVAPADPTVESIPAAATDRAPTSAVSVDAATPAARRAPPAPAEPAVPHDDHADDLAPGRGEVPAAPTVVAAGPSADPDADTATRRAPGPSVDGQPTRVAAVPPTPFTAARGDAPSDARPPAVRVHIGRVEVRVSAPSAPSAAATPERARAGRLRLEDYLDGERVPR